MDYFSLSMLTKQSTNSSTEPLLTENERASIDLPITENNCRRTSRSGLRYSDSWARKRTLMQRGYEWTTTLDRENSMKTNYQTGDHPLTSNMKSLPNSITNSSTHTNQHDQSSPPPIKISINSKSDSPESIPSNLLRRRRSSRRLPDIPADNITLINSANNNNLQKEYVDEV